MLRGLQPPASAAASAGAAWGGGSSSRAPCWPQPVRRGRAAAAPAGPCRRLTVSVAAAMDWGNRRNEREARPENVPGSFFVDATCIDCDTCRWMAPDTFGRVGRQSAVVAQPADGPARVRALQALLSCPTYSIHVTDRTSAELKAAQQGLPAPVPGLPPLPLPPPAAAAVATPPVGSGAAAATATATATAAAATAAEPLRPGVYYTGWTTEKSYAGCPYLVVRPEGNILVDSPRYNPVLAARLAAAGGVRHMFLTHRDDVGDHQAWADHFGAQRILHESECNSRQGTDKVEVKLRGEGPWVLTSDGRVVPAAEAAEAAEGQQRQADVEFVFTPGHTAGHVCMYYAPQQVLFSGDHLCSAEGEVEGGAQDQLHVFADFCWHDFRQQLRSVAGLLQYDWLHVLPAHGRRAHLRDAAARLAAVSRLLQQHGAAAEAEAAAGKAAAVEVA
ncbi:hypothetical protein HXX76_014200 [Chlamydomonas incerta]|uniref:Metallo-beta-lactamase domain-containing protein n=1 Tax=Chlamydomonas incerta TaxID=51695 RepID=A0A835SRV6_CHLIN|nr:hypothetical protein HXX76_014200 [Chlamydomonas incerta]|eukprot:KAG2424776.1 hypothetical protein HXX76_014200 [Chlamydomonas incerta]